MFPEPTHSKAGGETLFGGMRKWKAVRDVLDMEDEGESIFGRKRPLVEKTLERIYAGLIKFVAGGKVKFDAWMLKYNSTNQKGVHIPPSLDGPCPTVACQSRLGLVKCNFLSKQFGGDPMSKNTSVDHGHGVLQRRQLRGCAEQGRDSEQEVAVSNEPAIQVRRGRRGKPVLHADSVDGQETSVPRHGGRRE